MKTQAVPVVSMNDGNTMPILGFGVWQIEEGKACEEALETALEAGYRHVDTAFDYRNEASVGRALGRSGIPREELFVTTKLWPGPDVEQVRVEMQKSLERLQMNYVDLYLIHVPIECYKEAWSVLESLKTEGKCRSIGVSNYTVERFERDRFFERTTTVPAVDQVEINVFNQRRDLAAYCNKKGFLLEAYRPLAGAQKLSNEVLKSIAKRAGKTVAQVMLRFLVQKGIAAIPKSATPERIRENINIFDFALDDEEMKKLESLHDDSYFSLPLPPPIRKIWY